MKECTYKKMLIFFMEVGILNKKLINKKNTQTDILCKKPVKFIIFYLRPK